jgi:hypothetical protein
VPELLVIAAVAGVLRQEKPELAMISQVFKYCKASEAYCILA